MHFKHPEPATVGTDGCANKRLQKLDCCSTSVPFKHNLSLSPDWSHIVLTWLWSRRQTSLWRQQRWKSKPNHHVSPDHNKDFFFLKAKPRSPFLNISRLCLCPALSCHKNWFVTILKRHRQRMSLIPEIASICLLLTSCNIHILWEKGMGIQGLPTQCKQPTCFRCADQREKPLFDNFGS